MIIEPTWYKKYQIFLFQFFLSGFFDPLKKWGRYHFVLISTFWQHSQMCWFYNKFLPGSHVGVNLTNTVCKINTLTKKLGTTRQGCGSGSGRIRTFFRQDPEQDPEVFHRIQISDTDPSLAILSCITPLYVNWAFSNFQISWQENTSQLQKFLNVDTSGDIF